MLHAAELIVFVAAAYAAVGVLFAVPFAVWGAGRLVPGARTGSWGFRVLILPGAAALWPILAVKLWRSGGPAEHHP